MTPKEIQEALWDLRKACENTKADASLWFNTPYIHQTNKDAWEQPVVLIVRPIGYSSNNDDSIFIRGNDFETIFAEARNALATWLINKNKRMIELLAISIVKAKIENGRVTRAALRSFHHDDKELDQYLESALAHANAVAAEAPFEIDDDTKGNGRDE